jgi:glucokinase
MFFIGIDIGGTKIAGGIVTNLGSIAHREECPTPIKAGGKQILADAIELARSIAAKSSDKISAIGIGAGGQIDPKEGLVFSATDVIPGWKGIRISEAFSAALGLPSWVDNDVNVLALAESKFGGAKSLPDGTVIFLALGTGVGGALLTGGKLHHGAHFSGGEFGHILLTMDQNARKDLGGATGTLEAYCSGPGLVETWKELAGDSSASMTGYDIERAALADPQSPAGLAVTQTGEYLGFGLVSLANALDPDLIIIGGGLARLGDALLEPARKILKQHALPGPATAKVITAQLGVDAPIIGAASLAMD